MVSIRKIILVVLDGLGIGGYAHKNNPKNLTINTLKNVWETVGSLNVPYLQSLGLMNILGLSTGQKIIPKGGFGQTRQLSDKFCESYSAHWEMAGYVSNTGYFYPQGLPKSIILQLEKGVQKKILGNLPFYPDIEKVPEYILDKHMKTGDPILGSPKKERM